MSLSGTELALKAMNLRSVRHRDLMRLLPQMSGLSGSLARGVLMAVFLAVMMPLGASADDQLLARAQSLLNHQKPAQALELLAPEEGTLGGEERFDYLLGVAWLETGEPGQAAFALERVVLLDPDFAAARLEMARAYFHSGRLADARSEFLLLREQNPPPAAQRTIGEYLARIETSTAPKRVAHDWYLTGAAGYDDNANIATDQNSFLGFTLDENSRAASSTFAALGGGGRLEYPWKSGLIVEAAGDLNHRRNPDASFVDSTTGTLVAGLRNLRPAQTRALALRAYRLNVDGDLNNQGLSLSGAWDFLRSSGMRWGMFARAGLIRYDDELSVKDVDQILAGAAASRSVGAPGRFNLGGSVLAGRDSASESGSRYSRDIFGVRAHGGWNIDRAVRVRLSVGTVWSDYDEVFFEQQFDDPREDRLIETAIDVSWRISPDWLLTSALSYYDNSSDIDIYEYDRLVVSVAVRRSSE